MKTKSVISIILLVFVAASVVYLVASESRRSAETTEANQQVPPGQAVSAVSDAENSGAADTDVDAGPKLIAYYFHRTQRCRTCLTIEAYAEETLQESFAEALESGEIEWRTADLEEPANEHFVEDYQLTASALVLVSTNNGAQEQWRNLERVWDLVDDELEFKAYVEAEVRAMLEQDS